MKFKPLIGGELSGSIGAITASHNAGGAYFRSRVVPTDPASVFQVAIRGFVAALTSGWNSTLSAAQRAAWDTYALNVPLPDALGEPRNVGGLGMYTRSNVPRLQAGLTRVDDGPTIFNLGTFTNPTFDTFNASAQTYNVVFTAADAWANEDDAAMLLFSSRPKNATINFFKGPYRADAAILGNLATPPTSPVVTLSAFPFAIGNRVFVYMRISRADGRLSAQFRGFGLGA